MTPARIEAADPDAITGKPVVGAYFIVLKEGITWSTWNGDTAQVREAETTNQNGEFQATTPLEYGHSYSMGILARGYQAVLVDNVQITNDLQPVTELDVKLNSGR